MFGFYERIVRNESTGEDETMEVRLLANPEDREKYTAKGYRFLRFDAPAAEPSVEERLAALEAASAPSADPDVIFETVTEDAEGNLSDLTTAPAKSGKKGK